MNGEAKLKTINDVREDLGLPLIKNHNDPVNQPNHYTYGEIETIDYIEQVASIYPSKQAPHVANVIKYISRAPLKNGLQDLEKAQFYLNRLVELADNIKE